MKSWSSLLRLFIVSGLLLSLLPGLALAAPLPLPDVIFYGTAKRDGVLLESGTVSAVLPRGGVISAPISPIAGTDYTYALVVPLSQYLPDTGDYAADSAVLTDTIRFYIDATPAVFKDDQGFARSEFALPGPDALGQTFVVNLDTAGPEAYFLGDVNANGQRDAADALLALRYDVGLTIGVTTFPPGPRTIYLPLCDIVADGQCNSSDALRILRCDVGLLSGADCPTNDLARRLLLVRAESIAPTEAATLDLRVEVVEGAEPDQVVVRVVADDWQSRLGAISLDVNYDPQRLVPLACADANAATGQPAASMCNAAFGSGVVRLNAASTEPVGHGATLGQVSFRWLTPDRADAVSLAVNGVFDREGDALAWRLGDGSPRYQIYLPLVFRAMDGETAPTANP